MAVLGRRGRTRAAELAAADVAGVWAVTHDALAAYTPDAYVAALAAIVAEAAPSHVCFAAHLPDARLRRRAGGAARPDAGHRRGRGEPRGRRHGRCLAADVPGQAGRRGRRRRAGAAPGRRSRSAPSAPTPPRAGRGAPVTAKPAAIDAAALRQTRRGAVPGGEGGRGSVAGRAHRRRRPRHQGAGAHGAGRAAGRRLRRRAGRVAADLRQRLAADGAPDRQLGTDGGAEAVRRRSASRGRSSTWSG